MKKGFVETYSKWWHSWSNVDPMYECLNPAAASTRWKRFFKKLAQCSGAVESIMILWLRALIQPLMAIDEKEFCKNLLNAAAPLIPCWFYVLGLKPSCWWQLMKKICSMKWHSRFNVDPMFEGLNPAADGNMQKKFCKNLLNAVAQLI